MKILPLIIAPNPLLKEVSTPVETIDSNLIELMKNMVQTMYFEGGVGLAGIQVGISKRILVMDVNYETQDHHHHHHDDGKCNSIHVENTNPQYFINPEIIKFSNDKKTFKEGCLSFPGFRSEVLRPETITVKFLDLNGKENIKEFSGIESVCIQHEIDHLNGITFVDHISKTKRDMILKKINKFKK